MRGQGCGLYGNFFDGELEKRGGTKRLSKVGGSNPAPLAVVCGSSRRTIMLTDPPWQH
jgi:hypothetical protein